MDHLDILAQVPLFAQMNKRELKNISETAEELLYEPGEMIINEGERDGRLFVLLEGEVEIIKGLGQPGERLLRRLGPGAYFGEMAVLGDALRTASVRAVGQARMLSLRDFNLRQAMERHPYIAIELLQVMSHRMQQMEQRLLKVLGGLVPICASCKSIRQPDGSWVAVEQYVQEHSDADFTHGICPKCKKRLYPELSE
ncbi:MAG: cyclic nucleotide-binding domain-containing protein [Desulfarculus sp.]|nr:cyclic nucleotide-binding domain-containing protein [Pseudomonadota bacterium]MBV1718373.1 cyclic nucleotide-binding domain-containing protein [Desulfarculus sp.]MBU4576122.1 cyclic nucleotide-binding domain-containing protein [Pseudomonadota bacterium]MBU4599435.1 cyclic nucleotide-binding domain-containing protein [Pseudomonadota bacterium]MBV1739715.1 cyclic nucleotide-binding domain-containing protein [Desulfarculus sp.]